jgi:hypothetical protein
MCILLHAAALGNRLQCDPQMVGAFRPYSAAIAQQEAAPFEYYRWMSIKQIVSALPVI